MTMNEKNSWAGRRVLITGLSGFIGCNLAKSLLAEGAHVSGVVRNANSEADLIPAGCNVIVGDVADYELMAECISRNEVDSVFHLAARAIVRVSARDPMTTYRTNVMGTVAVLEAARNVGRCSAIVVASSDKAYGDHPVLPYTEEHDLRPKNTYDTSKACMDLIAQSYAHNYGMPIVVTRCSNVYGPGDPNISRLIPNTINRVRMGLRPVLYDGFHEMEREFIYVGDVVQAYLTLGRSVWTGGPVRSNVYNIGGTGPVSALTVVRKICEKMGRPDLDVDIVKRGKYFKEIKRQYIDAKKLTADTGWLPKVDLDAGLDMTIGWYDEFFGRTQ